jgi:hypothetical protein
MNTLNGAETPKNKEDKVMKATINEKVTAHRGTNSMGTMFIYETFKTGEIVKVNEKSIRVHLAHEKKTTNGKIQSERETNQTATFAFWKNLSDGRALYKNAEHGIITL